jgi:hypothetical protein
MVKRTELTDDTTRAILYDGANLSQLGQLFRMDHRSIVAKIHTCKPIGTRNGADIYAVHEVAPFLVKPAYDIETYIKKMHHNDLPKMLTKEFWAGQRSRQEFEQREGNLWPTDRVVSVIGEIMKLVKMSIRLNADAVDRQAELSDRQRGIVKALGDGLLETLYATVIEKFAEKPTNLAVQERAEQVVTELKDEEDDEL